MKFLKNILDLYRYDSDDPTTSIFIYGATALVVLMLIVIFYLKYTDAKEKKRKKIEDQIYNELDLAFEELGQVEDNTDSTVDEREAAFKAFIKKVLTLSDLAEENRLLHLEGHLLTVAQKMKNSHSLSIKVWKEIKKE